MLPESGARAVLDASLSRSRNRSARTCQQIRLSWFAHNQRGATSESVEYIDQQQARFQRFFSSADIHPDLVVKAFNANVAAQVGLRLSEPTPGVFRVVTLPATLLSWMWVRVAEDVANDITWVRCDYCRQPMERHGFYRTGPDYCLPSHRVMANRRKLKQRGRK